MNIIKFGLNRTFFSEKGPRVSWDSKLQVYQQGEIVGGQGSKDPHDSEASEGLVLITAG
jgi:hypothetical protein